jgi:hypothetical protein
MLTTILKRTSRELCPVDTGEIIPKKMLDDIVKEADKADSTANNSARLTKRAVSVQSIISQGNMACPAKRIHRKISQG